MRDPWADSCADSLDAIGVVNLGSSQPARDAGDSWGASFDTPPAGSPLLKPSSLKPSDLGSPSAAVKFPEAGSRFLDFDLVSELGRGAFGRVFLARQGDLANRLVALKVSTEIHGESQKLAQLQHTHIVPIYSLHQAGPLQAVCMPYFGATTLGDVLEHLHANQALPVSGKGLVSTLQNRRSVTRRKLERTRLMEPRGGTEARRAGEELPPAGACADGAEDAYPPPLPSPLPHLDLPEPSTTDVLTKLEGLSYTQAILWVGARLADGLAHAHDRGIYHRDLKPANILITDEGQPMLLDFNLSEDIKSAGAQASRIGGTLPYMAPEHLEAFTGRARIVDGRSDVWSLGVILYRLLTGRTPYPERNECIHTALPRMLEDRLREPPRLREHNPAVTPAVEAIVRKCLEPDPARRYQTAAQLREDLDRQLNDMPLRHVPEPSLRERVAKWARRHPRLTSVTTVSTAAAVLLMALALMLFHRSSEVTRLQALDTLDAFHADLHHARILLCAQVDDPVQLKEGRETAHRALDRYGILHGGSWATGTAYENLPPDRQAQLRRGAGELLLLLASSELPLPHVPADQARPALERALQYNQRAELCYGDRAPRALWVQRAGLKRRLGQADEAREALSRADRVEVETAWDHYMMAREHRVRGEAAQALAELRRATAMDPKLVAAHYMLGNCLLENALKNPNQLRDAVAAYHAAIALEPDFAGLYYNRGMALSHLGKHDDAEKDFSRAIDLRPDVACFHVQRAVARNRRGAFREALADLDRAMQLGDRGNHVRLLRATLRERLGDGEGAAEDRRAGLLQEPREERDWIARGQARHRANDIMGALEDFQKAVEANPRSLVGLHNQAHIYSEQLGKHAEATAALNRVLESYPELVPSLAGRAVILARQGQRDLALADAKKVLALSNTGQACYQAACVLALTSRQAPADRDGAFTLLNRALKAGYGHDLIEEDLDLAPLWEDPRFNNLKATIRAMQQESNKAVF